jgi:hypothetical protein
MGDRRKLAALGRIAEVEKVSRSAAEGALARAREAELAARAEQDLAREKAGQAHEDWYAYISSGAFSPEHGRALGTVAVGAIAIAKAAELATERAAAAAESGELAWRAVEARLRGTEARMRDLRRAVGRRVEEARLAALEDRITLDAVLR